jgi:hypothetical protein
VKKDFNKWVCELVGVDYPCNRCIPDQISGCRDCGFKITLEILIKAMWAINKDSNQWAIILKPFKVELIDSLQGDREFSFSLYNGSEQTALKKALEYVMENK